MLFRAQTGLSFRELAKDRTAAVALSGFVALSLAPMLCSKLLRRTKRGRIAAWVDERFQRLEASYTRGLGRVLARPLLPLSLVVLFLGVAVLLFVMLPNELAPQEDTGILDASISAPEGTGLEQKARYVVPTPNALLPLLKDGAVRTLISRTPGSFGASAVFPAGRLTLFLHPWEGRNRHTA